MRTLNNTEWGAGGQCTLNIKGWIRVYSLNEMKGLFDFQEQYKT